MPADEEINTLLVMLRLSGAIVVILLTWLVVSPSTTVDATSAVTSVPLPNGVMVDDLAVATGSDGLPQIAYYDGTNGDLGFVRCLDPYCATYEQRTLDSAGSVGEYPAIVIGEADRPIIAYRDANADGRYISRLKVARCLDDDCNDWSFSYPDIRTFNDVIDAGYGIDMLVDGEILYISHGSKDPDPGTRLVFCDLSTCDGGTEVGREFGVQTALTLNPVNGFAVVGFSLISGELRMELCQSLFCSSPARMFSSVDGEVAEFDIGYESSRFYVVYRNSVNALHMDVAPYDTLTGAPMFNAHSCCGLADLDNIGPTGYSPKLLFGDDRLPVITYVSGDPSYLEGQLQVRRFECHSKPCTAPNTIRFMGSNGGSIRQVVDVAANRSVEGTKRHTTVWTSQQPPGSVLQVMNCAVGACGDIPTYPLIHSLTVNTFTVPSGSIVPMAIRGQGFKEGARILINGTALNRGFIANPSWSLSLAVPFESAHYGNLQVQVENTSVRVSPPAFLSVGTSAANVNCDRRVDAVDALILMRHLAGLEEPGSTCLSEDVDTDGQLTLADVILVNRVVARLSFAPTIYPPAP